MLKKLFVLLLALAMVLGCLAGCGGTTEGETPTEGSEAPAEGDADAGDEGEATGGAAPTDTLVVALPEAPVYMDPQIQATVATFRVTTQMFDRLVMFDHDMNIVPRLAESWEMEDANNTVFKLREGVVFHDGSPFTAEDVKFSLERCIANDAINYNYLIIDNIEIIDDYNVRITTKEPFNALLARLALDSASIVCKAAVEEMGDDFNNNPVGTGPFKFVSWDIGGDVTMEANEDYYLGAPELKKLVFRPIPEAINRTIGLETGEVGLAYDLEPTDVETVEANPDLQLMDSRGTSNWYLGSNVNNEYLSNVKVRQAIAHATNKQDFIDIVFNGSATESPNTMLYEGLNGYAPDTVTYDYDLDKAKALMEEAGYPDGFAVTLYCIDTQRMMTGAVVVQDQLRQIGIEVEVKSMDNGTYTNAVGNGEHDLFLGEKVAVDSDSMLRSMYHTEALGLSGNRSFWTDPDVDRMLDEACTTTDEAEAAELYVEIQTKIAEEVPVYTLAIENLNAGAQNYVQGYRLYPGSTHYIYGTYLEG